MKSTTTIRNWPTLLIGLCFAAITARTLFDDIWNGGAVTVAHLQTVGALLGAIAAGHYIMPTLHQRLYAHAIGLLAIFLAATTYVVVNAGARNAEVVGIKAAVAARVASDLDAAKAKLSDAEADLDAAREAATLSAAAAAKECASGKGKRCDGRVATRDYDAKQVEKAESHVIMLQARVAAFQPRPNGRVYAEAAKVIAALPGVTGDAGAITARLETLMPFAVVLICEVGTLVFISLALGSGPAPRSLVRAAAPTSPKISANDGRLGSQRIEASTPHRVFAGQSHTLKPAKHGSPCLRVVGGKSAKASDETASRRGRKRDQRVLAWVEDFRQVKGSNPRGLDVMEAFPKLPKATAYDYARTG